MGNCCKKQATDLTDSIITDESASLVRSLLLSQREQTLRRSFTREEPFDPLQSRVEWNHDFDTAPVGHTTVATIKFIRRDGTPYTLRNVDHFRHTVAHEDVSVSVTSIREPSGSIAGRTTVRVSFTPRTIGAYTLTFKLNQERIGGQAYNRLYIAGPPVIGRTIVQEQTNHMVLQCGVYYTITVSPKDAYGNLARVNKDLVFMTVKKGGPNGLTRYPDCVAEDHYDHTKLNVLLKLNEPGYYIGSLNYEEMVIGLQNCTIICLTGDGFQKMNENIKTNFLNIEHKAKLVPKNSNEDLRKVKCYISPRLLQIREQSWMLFTARLFTCRVCNSTRINFHEDPGKFTIDDGLQTPITLISENREIIAAVFYSFIQRNSGGAETFQEKQRHFQAELRRKNPEMAEGYRPEVIVRVRRYNLLESAMHATRGFKSSTWKSKFHVSFEGEDGIDVGGVSREFMTCICDILFGGRNSRGLFTRLGDDPQGLVHPTSRRKRDSSLGLQYFEFAGHIVGKCLFESAFGNPLFVKANFTRSFLAQLIGLRISWKHFETDDPEVYQFRVDQIRNSSVEELDLSLNFADEVIEEGRPASNPLVISFRPGGSKEKVTDANKMEYLNELARYRLVQNVSEEVRSFLKGLREFIPEELLAMLDENELELLMCGVQKLSFQDLRQNTEVRGSSQEFLQSVEWFWTAVSEFTPEELARLVQFVTGSSQIPPGGFSELRPPFLLASSGFEYNRLPYAHTCFNHLCLPNYDSYEQFRRSLMTAINEGSEGVLLS